MNRTKPNAQSARPFFRRATEHLPHLDGNVSALASRPGRTRNPSRDLVSLLRALHVDNPIASQELFRLRKYPVGDGLSVTSRANDFGLIGERQSFRGNEDAGIPEFL